MNFKITLQKLKKEIDAELKKYLTVAIEKAKKQDRETGLALQYAAKIILSGGKRIRPMLMYFGYVGAGGQERKKIIRAAVSIEIIHNFLLMHDDIIDRDKKRHSIDTLHTFYAHKSGDEHFGNSMAIVTGDLLWSLGTKAILESGFSADLIFKALSYLETVISNTIVGQIQDVCMEKKKNIQAKDILAMYENKTAKYTLEGPLQLGAILAGADKKFLQKISAFALPVGMAFQIQDDVLGLFESETKTGKENGGDIKEGKRTFLVNEALKKAEPSEKIFMQKTLGNPVVSAEEIKRFQEIIKKTGALQKTKALAEELVRTGKKELSRMKIDQTTKKFLEDLADYIVSRKA
jgi:geranylgeranyl diphosphate synthase, type I